MTTQRIAPPGQGDLFDRLSYGQAELNEDVTHRDQAQRRLSELRAEQTALAEQVYAAQCACPAPNTPGDAGHDRVASVIAARAASDRVVRLQREISEAQSDVNGWNAEIAEDRSDIVADLDPQIASLQTQIRRADAWREVTQANLTGAQNTLQRTMQAIGLSATDANRLPAFSSQLDHARDDRNAAAESLADTRHRLATCETYLPGFDPRQQALVASWFQSGMRPEASCAPDSPQSRMMQQHPAEWGRFVERFTRREYLRSLERNQQTRLASIDQRIGTLTTVVRTISGQQDRVAQIAIWRDEVASHTRQVRALTTQRDALTQQRRAAQAAH